MKVKKFLSLLLCTAMFSAIGLSACGEGDTQGDGGNNGDGTGGNNGSTPVQLAAPQISLSGNTISWSAVENADGYEVYEGTTKVDSPTATSYTIMQTTVGTYTYTVYATSTDTEKFTKSEASNSVSYTVKGKDPSVTLAADNKIYVVGDSTVCDYSAKPDNYYLQRFGYGTQLFNYLDLTNASQVKNLALSGRSSLSFLSEPEYKTLKDSIGKGDYLIIGFGQNDEKSDDKDRFTDPVPDYTTAKSSKAASFQYTLYENYVKLAKEKGATPILCTPIVRYADDGVYAGKSVSHVTSDGDYAAAIKKLGEDTETAVVDLTKITGEYYAAHNADAKYFHAFTTYSGTKPNETPDGMDKTHINKYGAKMISYWFATNLPGDCPLYAHVKDDIAAPTYEVDYPDAVNTKYAKPDYKGFDPSKNSSHKLTTTTMNNTTADWYHTAMGALGGATKYNSYKFAFTAGKFTMETDTGSKFAASQDGFGAIFVQIAENKNFKASAKVKATACAASKLDNQVAFGMMLRDDIYIDTNHDTVASNFVSAGVTAGGKANMSRTNALAYGGNITYALNTEYELSLERVGQVVTVTVKQGSTTVTTKHTDLSFVGVDNNYVYLCLFANRGLKVEFSNVAFEITGTSQGA